MELNGHKNSKEREKNNEKKINQWNPFRGCTLVLPLRRSNANIILKLPPYLKHTLKTHSPLFSLPIIVNSKYLLLSRGL